MAAGRPLPIYGDGSSERDYTYIEDALQGIEGAVEYTGRHPEAFEIVNLGGGRPVTLRQVVQLLGEALGVKPDTQRLPARGGDLPRTWADIGKARDLFGYIPSTSIEEGIRDFADWFRAEPAP